MAQTIINYSTVYDDFNLIIFSFACVVLKSTLFSTNSFFKLYIYIYIKENIINRMKHECSDAQRSIQYVAGP